MRSRSTDSDRTDRVLSDADLAALRTTNEGNMPHVATVTVAPTTGTRVGGALVTRDPVVVLTDEPCRLSPRKRPLVAVMGSADQTRAPQEWTLTFVAGTSVPVGAVAVVSNPSTGAVVATVRIGARSTSLAFEVGAGYTAQDVSPGGR